MDFSISPQHQYHMYADASIAHDPSQTAMPLAMPISSHFRRPSKVVKTSRNQSPKHHLIRRRTTAATHGHPRHPSVDQLSRRTPASEPNSNQERPLSWHPTSLEQPIDFSQYSQVNFFPQFEISTSPYATAEVNGLITPLSVPVPNEPQIQELMTPLEDHLPQAYTNMSSVPDYPSSVGTYYPQYRNYHVEDQTYAREQAPYQYHYPIPQSYQIQPPNYSHFNFDTAPPSPILLPTQHFDNDGVASPFVLGSPRVEKDELVGMGLYDRPQDVQSTLFGVGPTSMAALTAGLGKGLKLEESFEPPPAEEDDEEAEEEEDQEERAEQGEPEDYMTSTAIMNNNVVSQQVYAEYLSTYHNQTFYFDDKEGEHSTPTAADMSYSYYPTSQWVPGNSQPGWI